MEPKKEYETDKVAQAILIMEKKALNTRSQKHYQRTLGFIDGMVKAKIFDRRFGVLLIRDFRDQWKRKNAQARENFRRAWGYTE